MFWTALKRKVFAYFKVICYFYGYLVYFMLIRYILWSFGIFSPVLVRCTKKNLATLLHGLPPPTTINEVLSKNLLFC
jgi:hypothetical protein